MPNANSEFMSWVHSFKNTLNKTRKSLQFHRGEPAGATRPAGTEFVEAHNHK